MENSEDTDAVEKTKKDIAKLLQIDEATLEFEVFAQQKALAKQNKMKKKKEFEGKKVEGNNDFTRKNE